MSCRQSHQKCQLPAKRLPKRPPKCPPQAPAPCPVPCPPPAPAPCPPPAPSSCTPSRCVSGFGDCCSLVSHGFPDVCLVPSFCCDRDGCSCGRHGLGGCS